MQKISPRTLQLQAATVLWMLIELGVAAFAAARSHSPSLLAFASDSLVELLSAVVVLLPWMTRLPSAERTSSRLAGMLLFALALVVTATAVFSLVFRIRPEPSPAGIAITSAALIAMPILSALKRQEARRTGNVALSADSIQSLTCAWIALLSLLGLAANALFHVAWIDSIAALAIVPLLVREARSALRGEMCSCGPGHSVG